MRDGGGGALLMKLSVLNRLEFTEILAPSGLRDECEGTYVVFFILKCQETKIKMK